MFKSYDHKNVLKTYVSLWTSKSSYVIYSFILNNNSVEKNINIQQAIFFLKIARPKNEKIIINNIYLIIVRIKIRLLKFLGFSQNGLTSKYGIILNINVQLDAELDFLIISGVATAVTQFFFLFFFFKLILY